MLVHLFNQTLFIMRQPPFAGVIKPVIAISFLLLFSFTVQSQNPNGIDWSKDTISKNDAVGAKSTYLNMIKGSGQKNATERITLPVDKLKSILDACAAKNITEIAVMIVSLRQSDIVRYRKRHPESTATDEQLKGSQILVFKIPRHVFAGATSAKSNLAGHPLMLSLLAAGLIQLDAGYSDLPAAGDALYFSLGSICPPPGSCDSELD